ncbi:MAG: hypothetical protein H0X64_16195 [Gemmatimonadaceae bacterium]|nr:hypothetical protein [Gemmatimonadaceae bacterium]
MLFPLELRFKILALASQIYVRDANETLVAYVRQKLFKLKEDVVVYGDDAQQQVLYRIRADRIIDISAAYAITDAESGRVLGTLKRHGMRSFWRAHYEITAATGATYVVREESVWVRVLDGLVGQVPVVGMFAGYVFHPAYRVVRAGSESPVMRIVKTPALFEGRFRLDAPAIAGEEEAELLVLSTLMILLLERGRG